MTQVSKSKIMKRIRSNRLAMFGFGIILVAIIASLLGYLIMPDSSPMANEMHLEISTKKPLSSVQFLKVRKNESIKDVSWFKKIIYGQPSKYKLIPMSAYTFIDSVITLREFDNEKEIYTDSLNLADVVYALKPGNKITYNQNKFSFTKVNGEESSMTREELSSIIEKEHIVEKTFLLGTDRYGRDLLSRIILGTRVSLSVGFIAVLISLFVGVFLGSLAGFFRGWVDDVISWLINVIWSLPSLLLVIAISFALGKGFWQVFIAIGLSMWVEVARMVRGQILSIREVEYVEAAKAMGFSNLRIIYLHILPNILGPLLVVASSNFAAAILLEAGLSFLGFGAQPPMPTWGGMVKEHYGYIIIDAAYLAIIPGLAIMLLVFSFNVFSIGLRDAFDIRENTAI